MLSLGFANNIWLISRSNAQRGNNRAGILYCSALDGSLSLFRGFHQQCVYIYCIVHHTGCWAVCALKVFQHHRAQRVCADLAWSVRSGAWGGSCFILHVWVHLDASVDDVFMYLINLCPASFPTRTVSHCWLGEFSSQQRISHSAATWWH